MRHTGTWLAIAAIASGCSHTKPANTLREIAGDSVQVTANNGDQFDGLVVFDGPNVAIKHPGNGEVMPLSDIESIRDNRRAWGALQGFGIGAVVGFGVFGLLGALAYEPCEGACPLGEPSRGESVAVAGAVGGILAGLVGLVVGGVKGSPVTYSLYETPAATKSVKLVGPAGSALGVTVGF